jgi:hypothetical protein
MMCASIFKKKVKHKIGSKKNLVKGWKKICSSIKTFDQKLFQDNWQKKLIHPTCTSKHQFVFVILNFLSSNVWFITVYHDWSLQIWPCTTLSHLRCSILHTNNFFTTETPIKWGITSLQIFQTSQTFLSNLQYTCTYVNSCVCVLLTFTITNIFL